MTKQKQDTITTKIYLITNITDNPYEVYIGKTKNPQKRERNHKDKYHTNIKLDVIDECENKDWREIEKYWISQFKNWGFKLDNKNNGGGGADIMSEEHKSNIRKAKINHSCYNTDRNNKIGISNRKPKPKLNKEVIQLDMRGNFITLWRSMSEAQIKMNGHNVGGISECCRGIQKSAYGYKWKYGKKNT